MSAAPGADLIKAIGDLPSMFKVVTTPSGLVEVSAADGSLRITLSDDGKGICSADVQIEGGSAGDTIRFPITKARKFITGAFAEVFVAAHIKLGTRPPWQYRHVSKAFQEEFGGGGKKKPKKGGKTKSKLKESSAVDCTNPSVTVALTKSDS